MTIPHVCDLRPATDDHTCRLLHDAITQLGRLRDLPADHPAVRLHLICSLLSQGETSLSLAVADAHDHGHTDLDIRILLDLG